MANQRQSVAYILWVHSFDYRVDSKILYRSLHWLNSWCCFDIGFTTVYQNIALILTSIIYLSLPACESPFKISSVVLSTLRWTITDSFDIFSIWSRSAYISVPPLPVHFFLFFNVDISRYLTTYVAWRLWSPYWVSLN